ncbi:MAG: hypothetical protein HC896_09920 [Bacteroidales bacterium]|nr:hypothetical protein [Bacteroidales bacterium]
MQRSANSKESKEPLVSIGIHEVATLFGEIEGQILALHKCSSDDFLSLNSDFKNSYNTQKDLYQKANKGSKIAESFISNSNLQKVNELSKRYERLLSEFEDLYNASSLLVKQLFLNKQILFVPFKNFKQNLKTLKFLHVNYKLENTTKHKDKIHNQEIIEEILKITERLTHDLEEKDESINKELLKLQQLIDKFDKQELITILENNALPNLHKILEKAIFHTSTNKSIIDQNREENIQHTSEIVTKLQYQDIIRQKIEHIQDAHKSPIEELLKLESSQHLDNNTELYERIRDISILQAAQLIHANTEYQEAIASISEKFRQINSSVNLLQSVFLPLYQPNHKCFCNNFKNTLNRKHSQCQNGERLARNDT